MGEQFPKIIHHGAIDGVTGSCHQLDIDENNAVLIDCGLFQGAEISPQGAGFKQLEIDFPVERIQALLVTHCHIDHVGRIPYLLAAGFKGPIYCSEPTAVLLPRVLEDAVKIGFTRNQALIDRFIGLIEELIQPLPYRQWQTVPLAKQTDSQLKIRFNRAGHILGSAYIDCNVKNNGVNTRFTFSGDLGAPYTPLLMAPKSPYQTDVLVLESTYGDKNHENRRQRRRLLKEIITRCLENDGVILIPAFSIGRTQELLYELEALIHQNKNHKINGKLRWDDLEVIIDSPLANDFTEAYRQLKTYWDQEAHAKLKAGRHPLSFEQLTTIDSHQDHLRTVNYLKKTARTCIVIAASGMCAGGRIVNYLSALIEDPRTDILFVGYQAEGTTGRLIQENAAKQEAMIEIDRNRYRINAGVYTLSGYSAHADQKDLLGFVRRMRKKPREIRLVHGSESAKRVLKEQLLREFPDIKVWAP